MNIQLMPIKEVPAQNAVFAFDPHNKPILEMTVAFYKRIGYNPPWIGYFAKSGDVIVGSAAFKGNPVNNAIEIAYGVHEQYQHKGIGTLICTALVDLALANDSSLRITARTLPEENFSTKILRKNNFKLMGNVIDPEDGDVWEWEYVASI